MSRETEAPADDHDLERFVAAQRGSYAAARSELASGRKRSHWMWFVFPQLRGLGRSETARHYGIASRAEADAYLRHRVLGPRLVECTELVLSLEETSALSIFGSPDDLKFRSCMTLFSAVAPGQSVFQRALDRYFPGDPDARTLEMLEAAAR